MSNEDSRMMSRYQAEMDALGARERTTAEQHEDELANLQDRAAAGDEHAARVLDELEEVGDAGQR
jgi:hypothetical protein